MPLRILQIVTRMHRGGLENRLMDIYRHLDCEKVQFDFYTFRMDEGHFDKEIRTLGGRVYYNPPISIHNIHRISGNFKKFLHQHPEYKIVHAHLDAWCGILLKGAAMAEIPVRIAHSRTALNQVGLENKIKNIIKLSVNNYATHRFAVSRYAGVWLYGEKAVEDRRVQIWPNAIDCSKFQYNLSVRQEVRNENGWEDRFIIMNVGNCVPVKNHRFLLKIFAKVKAINTSADLIIVGGGNWEPLRQEAQKIGLSDSITFTGTRADVHRLLQGADVFVFPSLYEGLPGAVLEAQAAGLPALISDTVTDEVCITPLAYRLPLSMGEDKWADQVVECKGLNRQDTTEYFRQSGFDVNSLVEQLTTFYLRVNRDVSELD